MLVAPGVLGWLLPSAAPHVRTHVHLVQRVIVPLDGSHLSFRDSRGRLVETRSPVLVPPGVPYATLSAGPRFGLILHPLRDGRRVQVEASEPTVLTGATAGRVHGATRALLETPHGHDAGDAHLEFLTALGSPLGGPLDRRVRAVLDRLAFSPEAPSLEQFATWTGLSNERLRHLLTESLGIGYRRLTLWYRFTHALTRLWKPDRLSSIAAETGFADQAHLARTTRALLGHPPSLRTSIDWRLHGAYHLPVR